MEIKDDVKNKIMIGTLTTFAVFIGSVILDMITSYFSKGYFDYYNLAVSIRIPIFQSFQSILETIVFTFFVLIIVISGYLTAKIMNLNELKFKVTNGEKIKLYIVLLLGSQVILFFAFCYTMNYFLILSLFDPVYYLIKIVPIFTVYHLFTTIASTVYLQKNERSLSNVHDFIKGIWSKPIKHRVRLVVGILIFLIYAFTSGAYYLGYSTADHTVQYLKFSENNIEYIVIAKIDSDNYLCVEFENDSIPEYSKYVFTSIKDRRLETIDSWNLNLRNNDK